MGAGGAGERMGHRVWLLVMGEGVGEDLQVGNVEEDQRGQGRHRRTMM